MINSIGRHCYRRAPSDFGISAAHYNVAVWRKFFIVGLILFGSSPHVCASERISELQRFRNEYKAASAKLEEFYSRVQIVERQSGELVRRLHQKDVATIGYQSNDLLKRVDLIDDDGTVLSAKVANANQTFSVERLDASAEFALTELNKRKYSDLLLQMRSRDALLPFAPYCLNDARLSDFLFSTVCSLTSAEDITDEKETGPVRFTEKGRKRVKVRVSVQLPHQEKPGEAWFVFLPDDSWALDECKFGKTLCQLEYRGRADGFPIVRRLVYLRDDMREPFLTDEAADVKLVPAPQEAFTLSAFGIPENVAGSSESKSIRYVLLGVNIGLAVIVFVIWRLRSRRRKPTVENI